MKFTKETFLKTLLENLQYIREQDEPNDGYINFDDDDENEVDDDENEVDKEPYIKNKANTGTVKVAKSNVNVNQRGLYRTKTDEKQIGVMVRKAGTENDWIQAYYLDSCEDANDYREFSEKYKEQVEALRNAFDSRGVKIVLVVNAKCPNVGNPKWGIKPKTRRSYEELKAKKLNKIGASIYDFDTGEIIPNEDFAATVKQIPRGVPAFLVYLDGQLIKTFAYYLDASETYKPKKRLEVQKELAEKFVKLLIDEKMGTEDNIVVLQGMNKQTVSRKVKEVFEKIIENEFSEKTQEGQEFIEILNQRSIPGLRINDSRFRDRYTPIWTNKGVKFRMVSFNIYKTSNDFLDAVLARSLGEETPEMHTTNLAIHVRNLNAPINKRDPSRLTKAEKTPQSGQEGYEPKSYTRIGNYNVQVLDFYDDNDILLQTEFVIEGEMINNAFVWTLKMTNSFGRKKPSEYEVKNLQPLKLSEDSFLNDGSTIAVSETVQLQPGLEFDERNTIMSNKNIVNGLKMAIDKFKSTISNIDPMKLLNVASYDRSDIQRIDESIEDIVKKTIADFYRLS